MSTGPRYGAIAARAYGFGVALGVVAIIPGLNFLYSGHGGPAWLLLPLSFPICLIVLTVSFVRTNREHRENFFYYLIFSLFVYGLVTLGLSVLGAWSISNTFGLSVSWLTMWELFFFPVTLPLHLS